MPSYYIKHVVCFKSYSWDHCQLKACLNQRLAQMTHTCYIVCIQVFWIAVLIDGMVSYNFDLLSIGFAFDTDVNGMRHLGPFPCQCLWPPVPMNGKLINTLVAEYVCVCVRVCECVVSVVWVISCVYLYLYLEQFGFWFSKHYEDILCRQGFKRGRLLLA